MPDTTLPKVTLLTIDADELVILADGLAIIAAMIDGSVRLRIASLAKAMQDAANVFSPHQYNVLQQKFVNAAKALDLRTEIIDNE